MWLLGVYTYVRAIRSIRWAPAVGVAVGLGFATKLNIFFCLSRSIGHHGYSSSTGEYGYGGALECEHLCFMQRIAFSIIFIGGLVFWAHWPWLYFDTVSHLREYVAFHARHEHYPVDFFGTLLVKPPFPISYPWIMLLLTVPIATLILAAVGLAKAVIGICSDVRTGRDAERLNFNLVVLLNFLIPACIISLPNTPIFGGTKHWMPLSAIPSDRRRYWCAPGRSWSVPDVSTALKVLVGLYVSARGLGDRGTVHKGLCTTTRLSVDLQAPQRQGFLAIFGAIVPMPFYRRSTA